MANKAFTPNHRYPMLAVEYIQANWKSQIVAEWVKNKEKDYELVLVLQPENEQDEKIVNTLLNNDKFKEHFYQSWQTPNRHTFIISPLKVGYLRSADFRSKYQFSRSYLSLYKDRYCDVIMVSSKWFYVRMKKES